MTFQRSKTVLRSAVNRGGAGSSPAAGANEYAGEAILVMQQPSKLTQVGSIPIARSKHEKCARRSAADRRDDTPELAGSIPVARTSCRVRLAV